MLEPMIHQWVFALPTDTCYGLACRFDDEGGYKKIFELKGRDASKPLALVVETFDDIPKYVEISDTQLEFLKTYPFPFTLLAKPVIPLPVFLEPEKYIFLGLRVAETCIDANFRKSIDFPLFLTSANKSDKPECFTRQEVRMVFGSSVEILWEQSGGQKPSNVFRFLGDTLEIEYKRRNYS